MSVSIFDFFLALVPLVQLLTEIGMSGFVVLLIDSLHGLGVSSIHQFSASMLPRVRVEEMTSMRVCWQAELVLSVV